MVEESDNSDSWGSMLINAILVKSGLISGEKSKIHSINQEHQLMGSEKPKTVKDVSNKVVDRKVVDDLNPRRNDDRSSILAGTRSTYFLIMKQIRISSPLKCLVFKQKIINFPSLEGYKNPVVRKTLR